MKDLFVITGMIEEVNEIAKEIEREMMKPANKNDADFKFMQECAEKLEDTAGSLFKELEEE